MNAQTIFVRTAMGREPAMVRMLGLSAEQRWLLELIDDKRTVAQLAMVCSDLRYGYTALERLAVWGLIAPLPAPAAAQTRPAAANPLRPQRPASGNDAQLLARLLAAKPVTETLLTRAALNPVSASRLQRRA